MGTHLKMGMTLCGLALITMGTAGQAKALSLGDELAAALMQGSQAATESQDMQTPAIDQPFAEGQWTAQTYAMYIKELAGDHRERAWTGVLSAGYFVLDDVSVNMELLGYSWDQGSRDAWALGTNFIMRWHFLHRDQWSVYLDGGVGLLEGNHRVGGHKGTHFNLIATVGLGLTYAITDSLSLMGGARYYHMSNAGLRGEDRNPSVDGFSPYIGLILAF